MKKQFFLAQSFLILIPMITFAQIQFNRTAASVPQPTVTILKMEPEQPIEGTLVTVYFKFYNNLTVPLNGWIGGDMNSSTGAPTKSPVDWGIKDLGSQQTIYGAIMLPATNAGAQKKLRVYFYETQQPINSQPGTASFLPSSFTFTKSMPKYNYDETDINVAALVYFRLNTFTVSRTRAVSTDSDFGSLFAAVNDQPVMQPSSVYMGEFQDGNYPFSGKDADQKAVPLLETGPIALVPGINSTVHIVYTIYNGGGVANSHDFLKGYAEATANPQLFHGPRPGTNEAFEVLKKLVLPLSAIGACDGFVAYKDIVLQSNDIFNNPSSFTKPFNDQFNTEEFASQTGCGRTSNYTVSSAMYRGFEPQANGSGLGGIVQFGAGGGRMGMVDFQKVPIYPNVTGNRKINLAQNSVVWQRTETINGNGNFSETNDPAAGNITNNTYNAPANINQPQLVILRGTVQKSGTTENTLNNLNNGQLKEVTAIVQLIPGTITMTHVNTATNTVQMNTPPVSTPATTMMAKPPIKKDTLVTMKPRPHH
jgi:hypothetical protein